MKPASLLLLQLLLALHFRRRKATSRRGMSRQHDGTWTAGPRRTRLSLRNKAISAVLIPCVEGRVVGRGGARRDP